MAQGARVVPFEHVGVEILAAPASDGGDEVGEMVAAARTTTRRRGCRRYRLALRAAAGIEAMAGDDALLQMEHVADRLPAEPAGRQAAHLEDELRLAVVKDRDLRVGGLALVG